MLVASTIRAETDGNEPYLIALLDRVLSTSVTVQYTVTGTATSGSDYTLAPGTLTFAAGETMKLIPLVILNDAIIEPVETIIVALNTPVGVDLGAITAHTVSLRDSVTPEVTISANAAELEENAGPARFTVSLTGGVLAFPLVVHYAVSGTASAGSDYTAPSGTVTIPTGQTSVVLPITLIDDTTLEADETITVTLTADPAYDLGTIVDASTIIHDEDTLPVVNIVQPLWSDVSIRSGVGLMVNAEATRDTSQGVTNVPLTWSKFSGPGTVTFEAVTSTASAATFSAPGVYVLHASSTYGASTIFDEVRVNISTIAITAQTVGTTTAPGSVNEADTAPTGFDRTYTMSGAGSGISSAGTSDGFYFLATPITGDFDVKVRVTGIANPGGSGSSRAGLMVRASTAADAPYAMTMHKAGGIHAFQARLTAAADPYDTAGTTTYAFPHWIRLTRVGNLFAAYHGTDGATWSLRGVEQTIATMGASPLIGLAVTSAVVATPSTATFDSLSIALPSSIGPVVDAGAALTGSGPWSLDATATDDGRPGPMSPLWVNAGGAGIADFTPPSAVDTSVTFSASGSYRLRLTVGDGAITTFDETTANITVGGPMLSWRQTYFGTTSSTGDSANTADMDGDGLQNIVEYALGTSPIVAAASPLAVTSTPGNFVLSLNRDASHTDVTITIEAATTLGGAWSAIARSTAGGVFTALVPEASVVETGTGTISAAVTVATASTPGGRFFRVSVQTNTP